MHVDILRLHDLASCTEFLHFIIKKPIQT